MSNRKVPLGVKEPQAQKNLFGVTSSSNNLEIRQAADPGLAWYNQFPNLCAACGAVNSTKQEK